MLACELDEAHTTAEQKLFLYSKGDNKSRYLLDFGELTIITGARKHSSMIKCRLHIFRLSHLLLFLIALILSEPLCRDDYLWRC